MFSNWLSGGAQRAAMGLSGDASAPLSRRSFGQRLGGALVLPWVGGGVLSGCEGDAGPAAFKGIDLTGAPYGQGFDLTDMNGQPRSLASFSGQVVMLFFGFVQCPDVCPTALNRAVQVMQLLGREQAARLQVLFLTVDPERDTPELLRDYMAAFDPRFLALRGTAEQTRQTADAFKVFYKKVPTGSSYTMDHTALSYLFDPQGHLRVALRHEQTADECAHDVRLLLGGTRPMPNHST
jgi:protein SCO1/2